MISGWKHDDNHHQRLHTDSLESTERRQSPQAGRSSMSPSVFATASSSRTPAFWVRVWLCWWPGSLSALRARSSRLTVRIHAPAPTRTVHQASFSYWSAN